MVGEGETAELTLHNTHGTQMAFE
ncbi:protein of unknown function [Limnospira indica PCC 8005]|uniref:Uncharacterized protein n=1 Tax=Limnospira indica PCC 8005 TaxID=376219 RepID=A0A9P1P096_9CYAN|nr:protein of unknown function [Limnospira indica PCC 8005]